MNNELGGYVDSSIVALLQQLVMVMAFLILLRLVLFLPRLFVAGTIECIGVFQYDEEKSDSTFKRSLFIGLSGSSSASSDEKISVLSSIECSRVR